VSFAFLVAGFLATTNAGRVALAAETSRPGPRDRAAAPVAGAAVVAAGVLLADGLLDALSISPESFRIAAGLVLAAAGVRTIVWPDPGAAPFAAVLATPELAALAVSFGADEPGGRVLAAFALALLPLLLAYRARRRETSALAAQFLAALQLVVAVALGVSGIRDV
jgi:small neutral amino acid transporter SnatA (MarC family)